jgi:hypothetical protein
VQEIDHQEVHLGDLLVVVQRRKWFREKPPLEVLSAAVSVGDGEPFLGMGVEQGEPSFGGRGGGTRRCDAGERFPPEEEECPACSGLQDRPSIETGAEQRSSVAW